MTSPHTAPQADANQFLNKAKASVARVAARFDEDELYIVWFAKVLGNWKALVSTDAAAGMYWEVTYSGAKEETYVDTYKKAFNDCLPDATPCCGASEACRDCPTD